MKKPEIAKGLAEASGLTEAEAADRLDRVVQEILARLRRGEARHCLVWAVSRANGTAKSPFDGREGGAVDDRVFGEHVAQVVINGIAAGRTVEIDGLGTFFPDPERFFRFEPKRLPQVFLAYVVEDRPLVERLYETLEEARYSPLDGHPEAPAGTELAASNRKRDRGIGVFVACFSPRSVAKEAASRRRSGMPSIAPVNCRSTRSSSCRCGSASAPSLEPSSGSINTSIWRPTGNVECGGWSG